MSFLVDTNVLCELARRSPSPAVLRWASRLETFAISAITLDEIAYGLTLKPSPRVQRWFESTVETFCRVLEVTAEIARHSGILRAQLAKRGRVRDQTDMLIAATASAQGLTLATRNKKHFDGCGIAVIDPFADPS